MEWPDVLQRIEAEEGKGRLADQVNPSIGWFRSLGGREVYRNEMTANAMVMSGLMERRGRG